MIKEAIKFQDLQDKLASWTQESQRYSSSLKVSELKTSEETVLQCECEQESVTVQFESGGQKEFSLTGRRRASSCVLFSLQ